MIQEVDIRVPPNELHLSEVHNAQLAKKLNIDSSRIRAQRLIRRSLDARRKKQVFILRFRVWIDQEAAADKLPALHYNAVDAAQKVLVIGAGPAGLFAALRLIEHGLCPIVVERGKCVRNRRRDIAQIAKSSAVNPNSNYCFGEGGAGTFSDGKLYTRSKKRGSVERILHILAAHGAPEDILVDAHPHIGTNKLPAVVERISETITGCGGKMLFDEQLCSLNIQEGRISGAVFASGLKIDAKALVLATGHSARDVFYMLLRQGVRIESKAFALGVRMEHPQAHIDLLQYGTSLRHENLPPASYELRTQVDKRGCIFILHVSGRNNMPCCNGYKRSCC